VNKLAKILVWHGLVVVLAWCTWNSGTDAHFNKVTGLDLGFWSLGLFLLLISVLVLGYILFQDRRWAISTTTIIGLSFMVFFGWTGLNLIALLLFMFFNFWAANRVRREIVERKILNIKDAFYHGLTSVVLGMFIMISFAAYQSPLADQIKSAHQLPGQTQIFFQQIVDNTIGQKINASTPGQRQQILNEIASQTFQQFNAFLGPYFQYAPPVLAFGLFLILWGLSFLFIWLGVAIGMLLFGILKMTGLVRIENEDVSAEMLVV